MNQSRIIDIVLKGAVVGVVVIIGFFAGGLALGVVLGAGVSVAIFADEKTTRLCQRRRLLLSRSG